MSSTKPLAPTSADKQNKLLQQFTPRRIIWPVLIGLSISGFLIWRNFDPAAFGSVNWSLGTFGWLFVGLLMVGVRETAYIYRIRLLTDFQLSFKRGAIVIFLWEFASAVTPSIVGGTAFALFLLAKEKINAGRSTAIVLLTAFLDELFFVLMVPVFLLVVGYRQMFEFLGNLSDDTSFLGMGLSSIFWLGYIFLFVYTVFLAYGLFINPKSLSNFIKVVFRIGFLKRWREGAEKAGEDLIVASAEMRGKSMVFWLKAFGSTLLTWTGRYLIINAILAAFAHTVTIDHLIVYSRQIYMWVILLIPVSPGGAGIAEFIFGKFLGEFIENKGMIDPIGLLWRLYGYYPFLIAGAILLPRWIRDKFATSDEETDPIPAEALQDKEIEAAIDPEILLDTAYHNGQNGHSKEKHTGPTVY
ncbi:MAG: flippase-like domain-containing protein [Bacteroidia bacterium]|nr:flippase-like domain-containing protein [Bacteroidia bacterium]